MTFAVSQRESASGVRVSPPSGAAPRSLPSHPSRLSRSTGSGSPSSDTEPPLGVCFTYSMYMFQRYLLISSHRLLPLLCPKCLFLLCCPASWIISTIFLDSTRACQVTLVVSHCSPMDCSLPGSSVHEILQA